MMDRALLRECTVRLRAAEGWGTGFFVAPGLILTCFHVVEGVIESDKTVSVRWKGQDYTAKYLQGFDRSQGDLALLELLEDLDHDRVYWDEDLQPKDPLYTFGYTEKCPDGDPRDFDNIDLTGGKYPLITFQRGQVQPGFSGSPLLNERTGKICGVVNKTRDEDSDLGGRAIPVRTIFACFPELKPTRSAENPFTPLSGGIRESDKIFGREKEVKDIFEILNSGSSVAIIGRGGIGKTTLLRALEHQAEKYLPNRKPVYLNLESIAGDQDFYYGLCSGVGIVTDYEKPLKGIRLSREIEKHKILLLLDVVDTMKEKYFTRQVRSQLRDLANRPDPPLRLVVAANRPLSDLFVDSKYDSPFEGLCLELEVELWSENRIREFIKKCLFDTGVMFSEEEINSIIQKGQGYPRQVMQTCFQLYQTKINS